MKKKLRKIAWVCLRSEQYDYTEAHYESTKRGKEFRFSVCAKCGYWHVYQP